MQDRLSLTGPPAEPPDRLRSEPLESTSRVALNAENLRTGGVICTNWTPLREAKTKLLGFCDLYLVRARLRFLGCPVFKQDDGSIRVGMPSRNAARPDQAPDWQPSASWDRIEDRRLFEAAARSALVAFAPELDGGRP
jgi:hypothetical protein